MEKKQVNCPVLWIKALFTLSFGVSQCRLSCVLVQYKGAHHSEFEVLMYPHREGCVKSFTCL